MTAVQHRVSVKSTSTRGILNIVCVAAKLASRLEKPILRRLGSVIVLGALATPLAAQAPASNVPRATYIVVQDQEFGKMDADKSGKVSRAEIEAFQRAVALANARARADALFNQLDKDRSGQLSKAEFAAAQSAVPPVDGRALLAQLDLDKDGQVSLVEHRAGKLARFDRIDTDKDGTVTPAEMKAAGITR